MSFLAKKRLTCLHYGNKELVSSVGWFVAGFDCREAHLFHPLRHSLGEGHNAS